MKKERILKIALVLLPIAAVGIASMPNSILLYDTEKNMAAYTTFLKLLPEGTLQVAPILALMLSSISAGLAISFAVNKKQNLLRVIQVLSAVAVMAAVAPIMMQTSIRVLPNMWVPLLMTGQWIVSAIQRAGDQKKGTPKKL